MKMIERRYIMVPSNEVPFDESSSDPKEHSEQIRSRLDDLSNHLREDISKFSDPKAKALFETAAEVVIGLRKAFADFESGDEPAWKDRTFIG